MIVLDASVILEILFNSPAGVVARAAIFAQGETLHVPHLTDLEVLQVLRRYLGSNTINEARAVQALDDYMDLPLTRYPHSLFVFRVWELRHNLTAYDAVYI